MFDPADLDLYDELTLDELREDRAAGGAQARLGRRDRRFIDALQSSLGSPYTAGRPVEPDGHRVRGGLAATQDGQLRPTTYALYRET